MYQVPSLLEPMASYVSVSWEEIYNEPEESSNVVAEATAFHCYWVSFLMGPYLTGTGIVRHLKESELKRSNEKMESSCSEVEIAGMRRLRAVAMGHS